MHLAVCPHCFLEDEEEEVEEEQASGVASEEELAQPGVASRSKKRKKINEIELQSDNPAELERMID